MPGTRRIYLDEVARMLRQGETLDNIAERLGVKVESILTAAGRARRSPGHDSRDLDRIDRARDERTMCARELVGMRRSDVYHGRAAR